MFGWLDSRAQPVVHTSGPFESFSDALASKTFYEWCCASLNNENLEFYFSVELYRTLPAQARALKAAEMLRHFVREGATSQINIDHNVRSDLEAALPPSLLELVEKITADAKAKASSGGDGTTVAVGSAAAAAAAGDDSVTASSGKKTKVKTKPKSGSAPAEDAASLNVASDIFDVAQARVYELMERDLWTRFRVDQASQTASSPRGKLKTAKKPASSASIVSPTMATSATATPSTPGTPSKQLSPRRKGGASGANTVSTVSATMQAAAMVTQIKRVNGKIVVFRKGE